MLGWLPTSVCRLVRQPLDAYDSSGHATDRGIGAHMSVTSAAGPDVPS